MGRATGSAGQVPPPRPAGTLPNVIDYAPAPPVRGRLAPSGATHWPSDLPLERRTKIVATLGPATDQPGVLDELVAAGLDCARLNCSHGTRDDLKRRAAEVREAAARAGRPLALLFDLQGPKLRLAAN